MLTFRLAGTVVGSEEASFMEMLEIDHISAKQVERYLKEANGEDVTFNLNSGGGSVFAGNEIYTMLRSYSGKVVVNITGLSASIASIFMMGANEVNISPNAQIMVHRPSVMLSGSVDEQELNRVINMLSSTERSLAGVYVKKTGMSEEEVLSMMFNETWLTAEEALEKGFVDSILSDESFDAMGKEEMVAMMDDVSAQEQLLKALKNIKGANMSKKTFLEQVKDLLKTTNEVEEAVVEPVEAEEIKEEETEAEVEAEVEVPEVEATEEVKEEVVEEEQESEIVALLEKSLEEITALRAENAELKEKLEAKDTTITELQNSKKELENKSSKSKEVIAKLNDLLSNEEANIVAVSQATEQTAKSTMPVGYKGFRAGGTN